MIKRKGEELEMLLLKEKIEIIKYEPTSRYKDDNAKKATLALY